MNKKLDTGDVYRLCNVNDWFTCGTVSQYNKMFDMVRENRPIHDIALVIWFCSDGRDSEEDIRIALECATR